MATSVTTPRAGHTLRLASSAEALASLAAAELVALLETAVAWRAEAHLCLAGGSTPRLLHAALTTIPFEGWPHVHIWFGDERCVPPDHPDSNVKMAQETLLDHVPVAPAHIHRLEGELPPADAARRYQEQLQAQAARYGRDEPVMDALILGMGSDGHTASLFPGSPLLAEGAPGDQWCEAVHVPSLDAWRLTLTPAVLQAAASVAVLVSGAGKHEALTKVLGATESLDKLPARVLEHARGDVAWFVDTAALFGAPTPGR